MPTKKFDYSQPVKATTTPARASFKVNVDLPREMLLAIDAEANRIGIPRQSWIKAQLAQVLARREGAV